MNGRRGVGRAISPLSLFALALFLASCDDDSPTGSNSTTTTTAPASPSPANSFLRAAPMAFDARTVDVVVNGASGSQTIGAISYGQVSQYLELDAAEYRVQFFPVGNRTAPLAETTVTLSADQAMTAALVGASAVDIAILEDDRIESSASAGVAMANTIPDFPAPLDAVILNGPTLFENVGYLETTDATEVIPGNYTIQLRRAGTSEAVATSTGLDLAAGTNYTIFAVGSLAHGDMRVVIASAP
jgi:hypothetical protein